jgi:hypothetical protein
MARLLLSSRSQWRPYRGRHREFRRAAKVDGLVCEGRLGKCGPASREGSLIHEQSSLRPPCGERSNRGRSFVERDEPADAAWWNRRRALWVRAFRLPRMATRCAATTRDAAPSSDGEPACDAEVLCHRQPALLGAGTGRRGSRALQGDAASFYGIDISRIFPSQLLRTWHLQLAILRIATAFLAGGCSSRRR